MCPYSSKKTQLVAMHALAKHLPAIHLYRLYLLLYLDFSTMKLLANKVKDLDFFIAFHATAVLKIRSLSY